MWCDRRPQFCVLTINESIDQQKDDVCHSDKDLCHVEGIRLSYFQGPSEGNNAVEIYERKRNSTKRKFLMNAIGGSRFFVELVVSPPGELGMKEQSPLEAADHEEKGGESIPNLFRVLGIFIFEQG